MANYNATAHLCSYSSFPCIFFSVDLTPLPIPHSNTKSARVLDGCHCGFSDTSSSSTLSKSVCACKNKPGPDPPLRGRALLKQPNENHFKFLQVFSLSRAERARSEVLSRWPTGKENRVFLFVDSQEVIWRLASVAFLLTIIVSREESLEAATRAAIVTPRGRM